MVDVVCITTHLWCVCFMCLSMYVCVYVGMCLCSVCVCMRVCMNVCVGFVCMYVCVYMCNLCWGYVKDGVRSTCTPWYIWG